MECSHYEHNEHNPDNALALFSDDMWDEISNKCQLLSAEIHITLKYDSLQERCWQYNSHSILLSFIQIFIEQAEYICYIHVHNDIAWHRYTA